MIGGPRFYERAEIKDAIAYLQVLDNPEDADLAAADREPAAARHRRHDARSASQPYAERTGSTLFEALGRPEAAGVGGCLAEGGPRAPHAARSRCMAQSQELSVAELLERVLEQSRLPRRARGRADDRGAGPDREPPGARRRRPGVPRSRRRSRACPASSRRSRSSPTRTRSADEQSLVTLMTLHNAKGLEFRRRLHDRDGGGDLPARPARSRSRASRRSGGSAYVGMTRAQGAADADARDRALALGQPRRTTSPSRFLDELPAGGRARAAAADVVERLRRPRCGHAAARRRAGALDRRLRPPRHARRGRRHRVEPGGVVTVRFAEDGAERRLMLEYAPLEKIA